MSNYPPGMPDPVHTHIEMHCGDCGHEWEASCVYDLGQHTLDDESDNICPECAGEGE